LFLTLQKEVKRHALRSVSAFAELLVYSVMFCCDMYKAREELEALRSEMKEMRHVSEVCVDLYLSFSAFTLLV